MVVTAPSGASQSHPTADPTREAYDALAPFYDAFTHDYEYDGWLSSLEIWAKAHGLRGRDVLDVACGTGKSFLPLLHRGFHVTASDISAEMAARARTKAAGDVDVAVADMRALPWRSRFDLITCLDDAVNYLLTRQDLHAALGSMAAALRHGGILLFDTNSLGTYRETFTADFSRYVGSTRFRWRGTTVSPLRPGSVCSANLEVDVAGRKVDSRHVQRHWPVAVLRDAAAHAGFDHVLFRGQVTGGRLVGEPDEERHSKVVCLAAKRRLRAPRIRQLIRTRNGGETCRS